MNDKCQINDETLRVFEQTRVDCQRWYSIFERLDLKPRRYFSADGCVYMGTAEGWFRLSPIHYEKDELYWVQNILQYLEERSFANWAVPWQKTMIWEENDGCYLIQPWIFGKEYFSPADPAAIGRVAEILAGLHRCGRDYCQNKGIEIFRDRWSAIEEHWQLERQRVDALPEEGFDESVRQALAGLKKAITASLSETIDIWRNGINLLYEHQLHSGMIGHGQLAAKHIVWLKNDYYLLNWEDVSFQPKVADLAMLIEDVGIWEPEWITFLINAYTRFQPFWPEEYQALQVMLQYPKPLLNLVREDNLPRLEWKQIEETRQVLQRKEQCLSRVWQELAADKRWSRQIWLGNGGIEPGKLSAVVSLVETWSGVSNAQNEPLISVRDEGKLPSDSDILERLSHSMEEEVLGGRIGNIIEGAVLAESDRLRPESSGWEIEERSDDVLPEQDGDKEDEETPEDQKEQEEPEEEATQAAEDSVLNPGEPGVSLFTTASGLKQEAVAEEKASSAPEPLLLNWSAFPKAFKK